MKIKIIIFLIILAKSLLGSTAPINSDENVVTSEHLIKYIKKYDTNGLVENSYEKKIKLADKQRVLEIINSEIHYYENNKLSLLGRIFQTSRLCLFSGIFLFSIPILIVSLNDSRSIKGFNPGLGIASFLSLLSLYNIVFAARKLQINRKLEIVQNMALYVKFMPLNT